ncbi:hypothetical protein RD792_017556 [Penstemon davidsonii]|uniref:Alpha/beta hydrolase fold-3 domain-containing protein n=1 Tax=Penstemon davidsonii TaxID=160366 RepID=A0ABR0CMH9_9LAMI|nr:hypothetical protein RD792_017556 [Penstemon davidsonii]
MDENSSELLHDFSPLLKVHKDGRVERPLGNRFVPASIDAETGVRSKDVQILSDPNLIARLYLPKNAVVSAKKLPLLVYIHGGGFVIGSPFSPLYHKYLNLLVSESNVVAVSLEYRLAPEHPLPIAYDDVWMAFKWVASQSKNNENSEEWLKNYADFDRVYIGGDSAGGNIAHNLAIRVGSEKLEDVNIRGLYLNSPYFWGKDPDGEEAKNYINLWNFKTNDIWLYVCPGSKGWDDPWANPGMDSKLSSIGCRKVLYYVGEKDVLKDRGVLYKEALEKSGWNGDIEIVEVEGEYHCFNVFSPDTKNSKIMLKKVASFLNY